MSLYVHNICVFFKIMEIKFDEWMNMYKFWQIFNFSPQIHILLWKEGLPPCNHQKLYISVNLDQKGPEIMRLF